MKIAVGLEYCGSNYHGWQKQPHARSIQTEVESALSRIADEEIRVVCAGRTDTGVHALHQIIHFDTGRFRDAKAWVFGGNVHLPPDISFIWAKPVDEEFHARFSATGRVYQYAILNRPARPGAFNSLMSWECRYLDTDKMITAAASLVGEHDFTSFRGTACQARSPVRTVRQIEIQRHGDLILIDIEANAFLHHMVRNIAGVLMSIGMGKAPLSWAQEVLMARDRTEGGITASADGLYLKAIHYPGHYQIPENAALDWPQWQ